MLRGWDCWLSGAPMTRTIVVVKARARVAGLESRTSRPSMQWLVLHQPRRQARTQRRCHQRRATALILRNVTTGPSMHQEAARASPYRPRLLAAYSRRPPRTTPPYSKPGLRSQQVASCTSATYTVCPGYPPIPKFDPRVGHLRLRRRPLLPPLMGLSTLGHIRGGASPPTSGLL